MSDAKSETWVTAAEAAVRLGASERSVQRYAKSGRLRSKKHPVRGRLMIELRSLESFLAGEPVTVPATAS